MKVYVTSIHIMNTLSSTFNKSNGIFCLKCFVIKLNVIDINIFSLAESLVSHLENMSTAWGIKNV